MNINFYPERVRMAKEVERCVAEGKIDTLLSFCNSCMLKSPPVVLAPDCMSCKVGHALADMTRRTGAVEQDRYYRAC